MSGRAVLLLLALAAAPAFAQAPELEVAIEPANATVGDLVAATLTLRLPAGDAPLTPRFPDWSRGWGEMEVREAAPAERTVTADGIVWRQRLTLAAFRTGSIRLPPVAVAVGRQPPVAVATPPDLAVEIRSVLPEDRESWQPSPPAPPVRLELPTAFWWSSAALALAALTAAWLLRRRTLPRAVATARRSPWDELATACEAIDARDIAAAHASLSLALRRYLGRSFTMPAAESSTRELGQRLAARGLDSELVRRTVRLLREVDQVKFACAPATVERVEARIAEAREVAQAVEAHLHPAPAAEAAA
jgi:MYXO-CTERM domain-containing protein